MQSRDLIILFKSPVAREEFYSLPLYLLTFTECKCVRIEIINGILILCLYLCRPRYVMFLAFRDSHR